MKIITAIATDDGITTIKKHFGDAKFYYIYEISEKEISFLKKIDNSSIVEDETHADPRKAKGVTGLLKAENVNTAVAKVFGPNLKRIRSQFVCIMLKEEEIKDVLKKVQANYMDIESEWKKGSERNYLKLT